MNDKGWKWNSIFHNIFLSVWSKFSVLWLPTLNLFPADSWHRRIKLALKTFLLWGFQWPVYVSIPFDDSCCCFFILKFDINFQNLSCAPKFLSSQADQWPVTTNFEFISSGCSAWRWHDDIGEFPALEFKLPVYVSNYSQSHLNESGCCFASD